ncbi:MAG: IPT/TIG domain-containing protein [Candidatus Ozemobacteraceae bacterium]
MKRFAILLCVGVALFMLGCGGGSTSNPTTPTTTPQITAISPANGSVGTVVTIQGINFGSVQGTSILSYGGITVTPLSWNSSIITAAIPSNSVSGGQFIVTVGGASSNQSTTFTVSAATISSVSPSSGIAGTQVTIIGSGFGASQGSGYVTFNGQTAQIVSWSNTYVSCTVPSISISQTTSVAVTVWTSSTQSSSSQAFTMLFPTISGISPATDNLGATITLNGNGFGSSQNAVGGQVTIGGTPATVKSWSTNLIMVQIPTSLSHGTAAVIVTSNTNSSNPNYVNISAPVVSSYSPNPAVKDSPLIISGSYFGESSDGITRSISLEGYTGTITPTSWTDNQITFSCPLGGYLGQATKQLTINSGNLSTTCFIIIE